MATRSERVSWLPPAWTATRAEYRLRAGPLFLSQFVVLGAYMAWQGSWTLPVGVLPGVLAIVASAIGLAFRVWGTAILSAPTMVSMSPVTDRLITGGVFRLVRNPLYLGDVLIFTSYTLLLNPALAPIFGLYHLARVWRLIGYEEAHLRARWGSEYEEYCRTVPRLLPRLGRVEAEPASWKEGIAASVIWIGFVSGYVAATATGDLWSLTPYEAGGFALFFLFYVSRKISSPAAAPGTVPD